MIYFSDSLISHKIMASSKSERAIVRIYENNECLNEDSLLLAYPQNGYYQFDLSSFFQFYRPLRIAIPELDETLAFVKNAQQFTIKTFIAEVEIDSKDIQVIKGKSQFHYENSVDLMINRPLTLLPNFTDVLPTETKAAYFYLKKDNAVKLAIKGTLFYKDGSTSTFTDKVLDYQEGLYVLNCSYEAYASYATKEVHSYELRIFADSSPLSTAIVYELSQRINYYPFTLLIRNQLGNWDFYTFTRIRNLLDLNTSKTVLANKEEGIYYSESRRKFALSIKPTRSSDLYNLLYTLGNSTEMYEYKNGVIEPVFIVTNSLNQFDLSLSENTLSIEFQYAKLEENYV